MMPTNCSAAKQLAQFSRNIRNPLIYYVNRYFLMFGQIKFKSLIVSMNGF